MSDPVLKPARRGLRARRWIFLLALLGVVGGLYSWNPFGTPDASPLGRLLGIDFYRMRSDSMMPAIDPGDIVMVSFWPYQFRDPRPGEIVVLRFPTEESFTAIMRVVAVGESTVELVGCRAIVNGNQVNERYATTTGDPSPSVCDLEGNVVPTGSYYLLSDNRMGTVDSRLFGSLPRASILAKVVGQ